MPPNKRKPRTFGSPTARIVRHEPEIRYIRPNRRLSEPALTIEVDYAALEMRIVGALSEEGLSLLGLKK